MTKEGAKKAADARARGEREGGKALSQTPWSHILRRKERRASTSAGRAETQLRRTHRRGSERSVAQRGLAQEQGGALRRSRREQDVDVT